MDSCIVMVRGELQMSEFRETAGDLRLGSYVVQRSNLQQHIDAAHTYGAEILFVAHGDDRYLRNREIVADIKEAGLAAGASIINTRCALEAARQDGCDAIVTDRADQLEYFVGVS